jgi:hypothetical protein
MISCHVSLSCCFFAPNLFNPGFQDHCRISMLAVQLTRSALVHIVASIWLISALWTCSLQYTEGLSDCSLVIAGFLPLQSFKTVAAAIKSHPGHMEVTLEFQRCER